MGKYTSFHHKHNPHFMRLHFSGAGGQRIADITEESLVHGIHHHLQSGGLMDRRLSAKINIQFHRGCNCNSAQLRSSQQSLSEAKDESRGSKMEDILVIASQNEC